MMKKRRQLGATLAIALVLTPLMTPVAQANTMQRQATTAGPVVQPKADDAKGYDHPIESSSNELAPGVTDNRSAFIGDKNSQDVVHTVSVDFSKNATLRPGLPDDGEKYGLQTVRDQANAAIKKGHQVVAAVNADFFNMSSGEPSGTIIKDGKEIHASKPNSGESFFGLTRAGKPVIGDQADYDKEKGNLEQALGGLGRLVKDGQVQSADSLKGVPGTPHSAHTAVGIKADGTVFFVSVDGQQPPYSDGMSLSELAKLMKDKGAVDAINFDGGGSTTYLSRTPGEKDLSLKNRPSDRSERKVSTSWLIVTNAKSDHQLDRAEVSPKDQAYLAGTKVDFKASGVDAAGYDAKLPTSGLTWTIDDKSLGSIDNQGVFTSNGKTGNVTVELKQGNKVLGKSTVTLAKPDRLSFLNKELSLAPGEKRSLNLTAYAGQREVHLKDDEVKWDCPANLGVMSGYDEFQGVKGSAGGTIKATLPSVSGLEAQVNVQVGQLPKTIVDFEDGVPDWTSSTSVPAVKGGISTVTADDGEVRFGKKALRVDFDYTDSSLNNKTAGSYAGPKDQSINVPSAPKSIGMWVYATPEAQGDWLRMAIHDGANAAMPLDFVDTSTGIDWTGWKYVEAPLPDGVAYPIRIDSKLAIRVMSVKTGMPGGGKAAKGHIFVDNIRAVYGVNKDDLKNPIVDSIDVAGKTFTDSNVTITTKLHDDPDDPNMSGIDWDNSKVYVDDHDYSADKTHFIPDKDGLITLKGLKFMNGTHHVKVVAVDKFGNKTEKEAYFTVKANQATGIHLNQLDKTVKLGDTAKFNITADDLTKLKSAVFKMKLAPGFTIKSVDYAVEDSKQNGYATESKDGTTTFTLKNLGTDKTKPLMTVTLNVPRDTPADAPLTYQLLSGAVELKDAAPTDMALTVASEEHTVKAQADYQVKHTPFVAGLKNTVTILDAAGKPATGVDVFAVTANGQSVTLGKTNAQGEVPTDKLPTQAGKIKIGADNGAAHSFLAPTIIYAPGDKTSEVPSHLLTGASQDPTTRKTITWMTKPVDHTIQSLMQIATDKDYAANKDKAFKTSQSGRNSLFTYDSDTSAVTVNRVDAKGLKPGTSYAYRVGDGTNWSAVRHFTTLTDSNKFSFNVFGDTQVGNYGQLNDFDNFLNGVEKSQDKPAFGIHVGDFNDDQTLYTEAEATARIFDEHPYYDSMDMLHVMGNHEYMGDDGSKSIEMLGVPNGNGPKTVRKGTYSVDYGNMHIASIGWTDDPKEMQRELDWLKQDMQASKKTWRVVTTHQPAYNKNPADSRSTMFNKMLPPVCDELGIDVVFSGHDHSYGRTFPLVGGKKAAHGTTYIAAGHTGEKTYDIRPNQPEVWDMIQTEANKKQKTFLTVKIDGNKLSLLTVDAQGNQVDAAELTAMDHTATTHPGSTTPGATHPGSTAPGTSTPGGSTSGSATPGVSKPETSKPSVTKPEPSQPTTPSATKPTAKKTPAKVIGVRGLALYRKPNFSKGARMNSFSKQPQMHQPEFAVLGTVKAKNGRLRFHVRDVNRKSKTYKQTGYITASSSYVQNADYTKLVKRVTVINAKGLSGYKSAKLTGKVKHHYRQGQVLRTKRLIHRGQSLVFQLTNGAYITANKQQVQAGKLKMPRTIRTKHRVTLYKEAELKHRLRGIAANKQLKVQGWDYSAHGTLRYRVAGGYVTANHNLVK
ncbi:hypothetical protein LZY01_13400 [Levilactobacillus zymae]|uniref:N-acetylmuramoyl-L-alanine amidase n=1 Tax=Levilactobacillus zymae TaxID=267363 RepID=A0ABQ0X0I0_9LACO|nr:phosphodiester glycosidase family protein [Levilactobacillus zymae]KRL13162.1 N-acetylmuramoyl-L-alanine amidase [Levilactobacillus zymae DSM 19395]GEO72172.1 hypothetical protein LZY01_13400 [Levilactobacillus zymae]